MCYAGDTDVAVHSYPTFISCVFSYIFRELASSTTENRGGWYRVRKISTQAFKNGGKFQRTSLQDGVRLQASI